MSKKMTFLIAGALMALVFTSLAGTAAAKETKLKCEGAGKCTFGVAGGIVNLSIVGGVTVKCTGVIGSGEVTGLNAERESSTSSLHLVLIGCREQNTIFHFACGSIGAEEITLKVAAVHNIALETGTKAGVLLTSVSETFTCAGGFASTQITGNLIGESETSCNTNTATVQRIVFTTTGDGAQSLTTYTGSTFKLEAKTSHTGGGSYANGAQDGTLTLTYNQNVLLTCA